MNRNFGKSAQYVIGSQYFLYFGVLGIFLPYFNLYCYHIDFSGFQIGVLSAVRSLTLVAFPLVWGALADRFQIRKPIYIACSFISTAIWGLFLVTTDFDLLLMITVFYGIFFAPIISFLEAFTLDVLGREKKRYGRFRVWGSVSFIAAVVIMGRVIDSHAIHIILVFILAGSILQAVISIKVPRIKVVKEAGAKSDARSFFKKEVIIFLSCAFLMLVSHGAYYAFFSIHLENLGFSNTFIGIDWALASIAEIMVMIKSDLIFERFSMEKVLVFSFGIAVLRWMILFFAESAWVIMISQVLHAATYGAFHVASILYIDYLSPQENKTLGQAINNAVTYGLGLMIGFFVNGYLYEVGGSFTLFIISALIALAGGIMFTGSYVARQKNVFRQN